MKSVVNKYSIDQSLAELILLLLVWVSGIHISVLHC